MKEKQSRPPIPCPECGRPFVPRHHLTAFCCPAHQRRFHNLMGQRGKALLPFAMVSRKGKSGFTAERKYALRCYNALVDKFNADDKASWRRPELVVSAKLAKGWAAADLG